MVEMTGKILDNLNSLGCRLEGALSVTKKTFINDQTFILVHQLCHRRRHQNIFLNWKQNPFSRQPISSSRLNHFASHSPIPPWPAVHPMTPSGSTTYVLEERWPPDVAGLWEGRVLDDLRCHPGVGTSRTHTRRTVNLSRQTKVRYLESLVSEVVILESLVQQN